MSTPDEECILREQAIKEIMAHLKAKFEAKGKQLSEAALRKMATKRHDNHSQEFKS
jgi:hypothetical protein